MAWLGRIDAIRIKLGFPAELFEQAVRPLIAAYGEWAQSLAGSESHHLSDSGGLIAYSIGVASRALDYRRGQILPPGAAPEAIGEQAHRWTYAVFVAALLHRLRRPESAAAESVALSLLNRWVPPPILQWIAMDDGLMRELNAFLSGDETAQAGVIGRLVQRAEVEATRRNVRGARSGGCIQLLTAAETPLPTTAMKCEGKVVVPELESGSVGQHSDEPGREPSDQVMPGPVPTHFTRPVISEAEYLEDSETKDGAAAAHRPKQHPSREAVPFRCGRISVPQTVVSRVSVMDDAAPEAARRFMSWLQQGLVDGGIRINEVGALVHFVDEGMLMVSPRIFKEYAEALGPSGKSTVAERHGVDVGRWIQRQVLRARWHVQAENGINILAYQVTRRGRAGSRLCGVVIKSPERFVSPVPSTNPVLVRLRETDFGRVTA